MPHRSRATPRPDRLTRPVPAAIAAAWLSCVTLSHHIGPTGFAAVGLATYAAGLAGLELVGRLKGPGRVLIVEDHPDLCRMFAAFFTHARWTVATAGTVAAARTLLDGPARTRPDWILLDLNLPDGFGSILLRHARRLRPSPRVAVVSGAYPPGSPEWDEVLGLGADIVLSKPVEVGELMKMMDGVS
jgi:CheY-like chemotaxis protein